MNIGLVVGEDRALLIDTGSGPATAEALWAEVREITDLPLVAVNTHGHFDHLFGNARLAAFGVEQFWAHPAVPRTLSETEESQRKAAVLVDPSMAEGQPHATVHAPTHVLERLDEVTGALKPTEIDLGGITATLFYLGRGHTDQDILIGAGGVLFTGDLVEQGGDPHFEDSFPDDWVKTLGKITALEDIYSVVVPGHGMPVDIDFVKVQRATMRQAIRITRTAMGEASSDMTKAVPILPYGPAQSRALLRRLRTLADWEWMPGSSAVTPESDAPAAR
jgi:glyoxylase-like metal-dependent hydrolase (beta-lactamase superfamily II)